MKDSQIATNQQKWKPTANMMKWLDTAIQIRSLSPTEISQKGSLTRELWYTWIKNPKFNDWFLAEWNQIMRSYGPALDVMGLDNAKRDFRYWESMQKRVGNLQDTPNLTQINTKMEVTFEKDDKEVTP